MPYSRAALVAAVVIIGVSIGAAWAFTLWVDEPAVTLLKRAYTWFAAVVSRVVPAHISPPAPLPLPVDAPIAADTAR